MPGRTRIHDRDLLDALERLERSRLHQDLWRVCWVDTDPCVGSAGGGRWHPSGSIEGLYTSTSEDGAIAEVHHHLALAPVYSSAAKQMWKLRATLDHVLDLSDQSVLAELGVTYEHVEKSQEIGATAHFLEYQAVLVPSYRWQGSNALIFPEYVDPGHELTVIGDPKPINWPAWLKKNRQFIESK